MRWQCVWLLRWGQSLAGTGSTGVIGGGHSAMVTCFLWVWVAAMISPRCGDTANPDPVNRNVTAAVTAFGHRFKQSIKRAPSRVSLSISLFRPLCDGAAFRTQGHIVCTVEA
jgi:hypothetical protein